MIEAGMQEMKKRNEKSGPHKKVTYERMHVRENVEVICLLLGRRLYD